MERVMSDSIESVSETIIMLMKSTGRYVHLRIHNQKHKDVYASALKKCIALVEANPTDFDLYRFNIMQRENYEAYEYRPSFWNKKTHERHYATMAARQALEIVDNLYGRFVTGMSDTEPRNYKGKGIILPGDEGVF